MPALALNGDMQVRVAVDTREQDWQPSPSPRVHRKRLHRVGGAEEGQVTSVVRYDRGSRFPVHDHPDGEEILVLEGVFSDEHGHWPVGTYLLNPEGHRHAPFSEEGCVLFVKLRQYSGDGRRYVALDTGAKTFRPGERTGVEEQSLYADPRFPDVTRLERWAPGAVPGTANWPGGVEIFVLSGDLADDDGSYGAGSWLRLPPGAHHEPRSAAGAKIYVKAGGVEGLRSAPS